MTAPELPWDVASRVPWHVVGDPARQWATMPSFMVGEILFIAGAAAAFVHAWGQGEARSRHLLAWVAALLTGTANDVTFMALPLVNNFWQAQATVMLTPRLPLYIPCVYVCFLYVPTVAVWRANLPLLSRAALTGVAALAFYAAYDVVGAKFLWWTWHGSDPAIAHRILGAPAGSSMFVVGIAAAFAWLLGRVVDRDLAASGRSWAKGLALVCGLSTVLMMVQVTVLRTLDGGVPGPRGLLAMLVLYAALGAVGLRRARPFARRPADRLLRASLAVYFATFVAIAASCDPAAVRCTSLHQTYGPCHVPKTDVTGATRYEFACAADVDQDYAFDCLPSLPQDGADWYTVCGRPFPSRGAWVGALALLCLAGAVFYGWLLGAVRVPVQRGRPPVGGGS